MDNQLKKIITRIHPDRFHSYPSIQQINETAVQQILSFWNAGKDTSHAIKSFLATIRFYYYNQDDLFEKVEVTLELRNRLLQDSELRSAYVDYAIQFLLFLCGGRDAEPSVPEGLEEYEILDIEHPRQEFPESFGVDILLQQMRQKLGNGIQFDHELTTEQQEKALGQLMNAADIMQHLNLENIQLIIAQSYHMLSSNVCNIPYDFELGECLRYIEENFPEAIRDIQSRNRHLTVFLKEKLGCLGVNGTQICSITQLYLGMGRLNLYTRQLKVFDLKETFLMISVDYFNSGQMFYLPWNFDIESLQAHLSQFLAEHQQRRKKNFDEMPIQLSFEFAA
ncbi:MAG: DUF4460 domain-containing protein [SAR324 cluster bacterium]|nr:DUF4460 domain-containing protein [SAR324 cluster bacterium]